MAEGGMWWSGTLQCRRDERLSDDEPLRAGVKSTKPEHFGAIFRFGLVSMRSLVDISGVSSHLSIVRVHHGSDLCRNLGASWQVPSPFGTGHFALG